jgi:FkbM family methyltransferase
MKNRNKALHQRMYTDGVVLEMTATFYNEFFIRRDYEWWHQVQPGDVVVDMGACVGMMTAHALDRGASKVYMIEANRELLKTAIRNVSEYMMNEPIPKVYPINCFIGKCNKEGLYVTETDQLLYNQIDRMSFKEFIETYNVNHIDFLKVDIEGNEYDIFNAENLFYMKNNIKHIAAEIHIKANKDCPEKFIEFRETFLRSFFNSPNHRVASMGREKFIRESIWDDNLIRNIPDNESYFMLYITRIS